jgi:hypothetical protein
VNDARREINGTDAIRRWVEKEMVGDHVTMDVREVLGDLAWLVATEIATAATAGATTSPEIASLRMIPRFPAGLPGRVCPAECITWLRTIPPRGILYACSHCPTVS